MHRLVPKVRLPLDRGFSWNAGLFLDAGHLCGSLARKSRHRPSLSSQTNIVIHRDCDLTLRAEVAFCRLGGRMAKQKLNLLKPDLPQRFAQVCGDAYEFTDEEHWTPRLFLSQVRTIRYKRQY